METVREFAYVGDSVSAGEGCEAAVTARTLFKWVNVSEYGELLYRRRFPLTMKGDVNTSYVRLAVFYEGE